jgi:hypothetical protein
MKGLSELHTSPERDLQKPVEGELKRLGFSVTHRVSLFVAGFLACSPREIKVKSEIRA